MELRVVTQRGPTRFAKCGFQYYRTAVALNPGQPFQ